MVNFKNIIEEIDLVLFDIKAFDSVIHKECTQRDNKLILNNIKNIADSLSSAYLALDDEDNDYSSLNNIRTTMTELDKISNFDNDYQELADKTAESYYVLEEVANQIQRIMSDLEFNPAELLQIEDRIMTLTTLKKKYGRTVRCDELFRESPT